MQGRPFDHSPNIIDSLNKYINNKDLSIDFEFLSEDIHYSKMDFEIRYNGYERVFGKKQEDNECIFGAGAQFIVSKSQILKRQKSFYENIVNMLDYSIDPVEGYDIERLHKYIFS